VVAYDESGMQRDEQTSSLDGPGVLGWRRV
jgi:hypothetical protein